MKFSKLSVIALVFIMAASPIMSIISNVAGGNMYVHRAPAAGKRRPSAPKKSDAE